jgi:hypothetical protein
VQRVGYAKQDRISGLPLRDVSAAFNYRLAVGHCLFDEYMDEDEQARRKHIRKIKRSWDKEYWRHSQSLQSYIENTAIIADEVLPFSPIPPEDLVILGMWDENEIFHPSEPIRTYFVGYVSLCCC